MMTRREFSRGVAAGAVAAGAAGRAIGAETPTQRALVLDAMGEIRETYADELIREMLDAGMNSVTVTLCDPKSFEQQAYEWAIDGVLYYDRLIDEKSEFYLKATRVADIGRAREQGKMALFYCEHADDGGYDCSLEPARHHFTHLL